MAIFNESLEKQVVSQEVDRPICSPAFFDQPRSGSAINSTEAEVKTNLGRHDPIYTELVKGLKDPTKSREAWLADNKSSAHRLEILLK